MNTQSFVLVFESDQARINLINLLQGANDAQASSFALKVDDPGVSVAPSEQPAQPVADVPKLPEA